MSENQPNGKLSRQTIFGKKATKKKTKQKKKKKKKQKKRTLSQQGHGPTSSKLF